MLMKGWKILIVVIVFALAFSVVGAGAEPQDVGNGQLAIKRDFNNQVSSSAGYSVDVRSITFWINGTKQVIRNPGDFVDIYCGHNSAVIISAKAIYNGPKGTTGWMTVQGSGSSRIRVLSPGKAASTPADMYFWTPGTDGSTGFAVDAHGYLWKAADTHDVVIHYS